MKTVYQIPSEWKVGVWRMNWDEIRSVWRTSFFFKPGLFFSFFVVVFFSLTVGCRRCCRPACPIQVRMSALWTFVQPVRQSETALALRLRGATTSVCLSALWSSVSPSLEFASARGPQQLPSTHPGQHMKRTISRLHPKLATNSSSPFFVESWLHFSRIPFDFYLCYLSASRSPFSYCFSRCLDHSVSWNLVAGRKPFRD